MMHAAEGTTMFWSASCAGRLQDHDPSKQREEPQSLWVFDASFFEKKKELRRASRLSCSFLGNTSIGGTNVNRKDIPLHHAVPSSAIYSRSVGEQMHGWTDGICNVSSNI
mmetsp:Transcript_10952/g.31405  ORF Transcript_10952/g.31405 Transcript_10952/m.31405 type:complete len:110 (-) Transcript_10952:33-362(-)